MRDLRLSIHEIRSRQIMAERTFGSNAEAFEYACEHLDCSLKDGRAVLGVVLAVQGHMCSVKIANREDKTIPEGTLTELLTRTDLTHVCFSAMLADKVPTLRPGDLVLYTTMPELAAANKSTVAGTVTAKVTPVYTSKGTWQAYSPEPKQPPVVSADPQ
jgi:hypothetical protein